MTISRPMSKPSDFDAQPDDIEWLSKTSMKKEMQKLQDLGLAISALKPEQIAALPLSDVLRDAIELLHQLQHKEAVRRQKQFIGKLMRKEDYEAIEAAYAKIGETQNRQARLLHVIERWRDQLIMGGPETFEAFVQQFPDTDRQQLRSLIKGAQQEKAHNKPPQFARKLFCLVRDIINAEPQ